MRDAQSTRHKDPQLYLDPAERAVRRATIAAIAAADARRRGTDNTIAARAQSLLAGDPDAATRPAEDPMDMLQQERRVLEKAIEFQAREVSRLCGKASV